MAQWKKVVVSGSAISQLNNDASYIADGDSGVSLSGSFSGSFFGNGAGLSGVSATFPLTTATANDSLKYFVNDGVSKYITGTTLSNYVYGKISGDATVAAGGALTIANSAVEGTMLNSNVADGTTITLSSNTLSTLKVPNALTAGSGLSAAGTFDGATARTFTVNSGSMLQYYSGSIQTGVFAKVSGDATINSSGVIDVISSSFASIAAQANSVAANSVALGTDTTGNYIAGLTAGTLVDITNGSGEGVTSTINVDLSEASEAAIANGDYILFLDGGSTGTAAKESLADLTTLFAGTGLSAASSVMSVDYGSTSGTAVQGNTTITLNQTAGEIDITGTAAQALGGAPSYTIGLANTITGARTFSGDVTFASDIVVQGTASFQNTTNLEVADQFILLNSGSSTDNSPGGIVVQQNTQNVGVAFAYDAAAGSNSGRWGTKDGQNASTSTFTANAYVSYVVDIDAGQSDIALYQQNGNIKVDSGDIWIYA